MSRYADGEEEALAAVYDVVAPRLGGYLRRRVRDERLIEMIVQQTFQHMHAKRGTFSPGARVIPWAFTIASSFLHDAMQGQGRSDADARAST